jgi:hypothetical protein
VRSTCRSSGTIASASTRTLRLSLKRPAAVSAPRTGEEKLGTLLRRRGLREQAQGFSEPVRGAGGRQTNGFLAGPAQHGRAPASPSRAERST